MKNVDHSYEQALIMHDNLHIHVIMNIIVTPTMVIVMMMLLMMMMTMVMMMKMMKMMMVQKGSVRVRRLSPPQCCLKFNRGPQTEFGGDDDF